MTTNIYRRILPGGLHGGLLHGARAMNTATDSIANRIKHFERQTSELEATVTGIVSALDSGAVEMSAPRATCAPVRRRRCRV